MPYQPIAVRPATESDLPAILSLLLTSFRQFPLFAFLYEPLDHDLSAANDTVFFWRRRLLLEILEPSSGIVVAEMTTGDLEERVGAMKGRRSRLGGKLEEGEEMEKREKESWRMWDWIVERGGLSQESAVKPGCVVVGFAIWGVRVGHQAGAEERERLAGPAMDFRAALRVKGLHLEGYLWKKLYQRRDQDLERYKAYLAAEEELEQRFYAKSCYYLDNLTVDFRYQRMGIGQKLLEWGMEKAGELGLPVQTEAGPMGVGLYRKMGFQEVGIWEVKLVWVREEGKEESDGKMLLPVMLLGGVAES